MATKNKSLDQLAAAAMKQNGSTPKKKTRKKSAKKSSGAPRKAKKSKNSLAELSHATSIVNRARQMLAGAGCEIPKGTRGKK